MFYLLLVLSFLGLMVLPAVFLLDPSERVASEPAPGGLDRETEPERFVHAPAQALRYDSHPVAPQRNRS